MKDLNRVGSSENFNLRGVPSFLQVCDKRFQATRKFYGTFAQLWFYHISINYLGKKIIPLAMKSKQKPYPSIVFLSIFMLTDGRKL